jgi:dodecin
MARSGSRCGAVLAQRDHSELDPRSQHSRRRGGVVVAGTVARVTEITARSDTSFEDAIKLGLNRATSTLRGVTSAWVKEQSVDVNDGNIVGYRVNLLVTFVLE